MGKSEIGPAAKGLVIVCSHSTHHCTAAAFQPLLVRFKNGFSTSKAFKYEYNGVLTSAILSLNVVIYYLSAISSFLQHNMVAYCISDFNLATK